MKNICDSEEYKIRRQRIEEYFKDEYLDSVRVAETFGDYTLQISSYKIGEHYWNYTKGTVLKHGEVITEVKRNYSAFPYLFVHHKNGNDYLLCGEDYQGYTIVNLTTKQTKIYAPGSMLNGAGFCWADIHGYDEDDDTLMVEGCYWACPYEYVTYDFSNPDELPLPEISRVDVDPPDDDDDDENNEDEDD
jgi:hypothetical protein